MLKCKRFTAIWCTIILVLTTFCMPALAADSVTGKSSGGSDGYANCAGRISLSNATNVLGKDKVTATTSADASGTYGVRAVIWYNNGTSEETKAEQKIEQASSSISVTVTGPNQYGNRGTAGHTFSSSNRGSWTGSTDKNF